MRLKSINPMVGAIIGVAGVFATVATTVWCTLRTKDALEKAGQVEKKEKAAILLKGCLPAGVCAAVTSAVIIAFGTTNAKQATALAGTYAVLNRGYIKHKGEIKDLCRPLLDKDEREKLVKKYFEKNEKEEIIHDDSKEIFIDEFNDDFYRVNLADVIYAEYQINRLLAYQGFATLNDFYDAMGQESVDNGDRLGWSYSLGSDYDGYQWIETVHEEFDLEDGMKATRIIFENPPQPYFKEEWQTELPF